MSAEVSDGEDVLTALDHRGEERRTEQLACPGDVDGPDARWGARGDATSIYIRDPDRNVVELRYY